MRLSVIALVGLAMVGCKTTASQQAASRSTPLPGPEETAVGDTSTQAPLIQSEEVTYTAGDTTLKGYIAWDDAKKGPRPGVLVVHQWWGHTDYVRKRARMLAELGYTALALDMYGDGKVAEHPQDAKKFMEEAIGNLEVAEQRFNAAYDLLRQHGTTDPNQIAAIGYCFGGAVVLHMARFGVDLDGVASFHGSLATQTPAQKGQVKAQVLVLHGADDPLVPREQVEAFETEMEAAQVDYTLIEFPGAKHAFTDESATAKGKQHGMPLAYDAEADERSWQALQSFLEEIFPPS